MSPCPAHKRNAPLSYLCTWPRAFPANSFAPAAALIFTDSMSRLMRRPVSRCRLTARSSCYARDGGRQRRAGEATKTKSEGTNERTNERGSSGEVPRSAGARPIFTMTVARRESGREGSVEVCALIHQQLRREPSRREQQRGAGVAESCVRNHKLERGREGEGMERGGLQRKYYKKKMHKV